MYVSQSTQTGVREMMTVQGQRNAHYDAIDGIIGDSIMLEIPSSVKMAHVIRPLLRSNALLPDYSARPLDSDAISYTRRTLIEHDGLIVLGASPCQYDPMAVEVWFSLRGWPAGDKVSMTVWYETREDGSRYLYGEW